ncbi:MAG: outer membrane protein transport protein [Nitrococcus sp.]|nr:outer membrane protein transport protein [Nitrococcus sp.]
MALNVRAWGLKGSLTLLVLTASVGTALASGYQNHAQSAKALGNALAGATAGAEDASYMAYNPAAIGYLPGSQITGNLTYIDPEIEFRHAQASTVSGTPIQGSVDDGDVNAFAPALAAKWRLNDKIDLGLGIYSFWGLKTDYNRGWIGRYHAVDSSLVTVAINPVLAFKPTPDLSLAAGLIAQYADARLTNAIDFGTIGAGAGIPFANPANQDGFARLTGNDWGFGFNVGLLYELTPRTRLGLAYRSKVEHTIKGNARITPDQAGVANTLSAALGGAFTDTAAKADLTTPAMASLGIFHQVTERLALMAEVQWTDWSEFKRLVVQFDNSTPDSVTANNWHDSWLGAIGASYRLTDRWLLRGGFAYDQSPVPNPQHRIPRIPDADRQWLALGATYTPIANFDITGSWVHLFFSDAKVDLNATDEGNLARGNLSGSYELAADVFSVQAVWRF